jgi:hypothetical protein
MAWDGTLTITEVKGHESVELDFTGFDADAEESYTLYPVDMAQRFMATDAVMYVTAAHATAVTDVIDIALQGSAFGTQWTDLIAYRYFRILCTTVGAGNTLRAYVKLTKAP